MRTSRSRSARATSRLRIEIDVGRDAFVPGPNYACLDAAAPLAVRRVSITLPRMARERMAITPPKTTLIEEPPTSSAP